MRSVLISSDDIMPSIVNDVLNVVVNVKKLDIQDVNNRHYYNWITDYSRSLTTYPSITRRPLIPRGTIVSSHDDFSIVQCGDISACPSTYLDDVASLPNLHI